MELGEFDNRVAIVTGGGSGIGAAIAALLAAQGASVVVTDIDETRALASAGRLQGFGAKAVGVRMDVTNAASVRAGLDTTMRLFGGLDLAVNNAGIAHAAVNVMNLEESEWRGVLDVNLTGVFLCLKYQLPLLMARGRGAIVNIASALGLVGEPRSSAYVASKHGVVGLTKSAALEFAGKGVRINAVCPGMTETPLTRQLPPAARAYMQGLHPMQRFATVDEVAELACFLLSERASFVTGANYSVDGGWTAH